MDANDVKKKFFDVTPPASAAPKATSKKRQLIIADDSTKEESAEVLPSEFNENDGAAESKIVVKRERVVMPPVESNEAAVKQPEEAKQESIIATPSEVSTSELSHESEQEVEEPQESVEKTDLGVNPLPVESSEKVNAEPKPEPEDVDTPITATYSAVDSLPDDNQKTAEGIKLDSQEPKIYDTKTYHIPIKETTHGHGTKSAFVFGTVFAIVFVGGLVYVLAVIAK